MKKSDQGSEIKKCLIAYRDSRQHSITQVQHISNVRSKFSYLTNEKLESSVGSSVSASRLNFLLNEELEQHAEKLSRYQNEMKSTLETLTGLVSAVERDNTANLQVDVSFIREVISELAQQTLLEMTIAEKISSYDDSSISSDMLVTMLACFNYPPYLVPSNVELIVANL